MKTLEEQIKDLEKRITLLESQRPIINVYPQQYQVPNYPLNPYQYPNGTILCDNKIPGPTCGGNINLYGFGSSIHT